MPFLQNLVPVNQRNEATSVTANDFVVGFFSGITNELIYKAFQYKISPYCMTPMISFGLSNTFILKRKIYRPEPFQKGFRRSHKKYIRYLRCQICNLLALILMQVLYLPAQRCSSSFIQQMCTGVNSNHFCTYSTK